jgi:hypothetical protein
MHHRNNHIAHIFLALTGCLGAACTTAQSFPNDAGASGGAPGAGGAKATGGTTGGGGQGGGGGTGGLGAGGGAAGTGGTPATGGNPGSGIGGSPGTGGGTGGPIDCNTLPLCDTFENTAIGAAPNSTLWTLIPTGASGSATVDSIGAHGSSHSLKVDSPNRLYIRNSTIIGTLGSVVHVRFYVRFTMALTSGHGAMIVTHPTMVDQYNQSNELRFGSQSSQGEGVFHWNTDADSANIPTVSPNGDATSFKPSANTWYCIELTMNTNGHLNVSVDGKEIPGLIEDGISTPDIDAVWIQDPPSLSRYTKFGDFSFGWQSYGSNGMILWYDDVALSTAPIGCQ